MEEVVNNIYSIKVYLVDFFKCSKRIGIFNDILWGLKI